MATKLEEKWMGLVAELPCCLCGDHGVQVHHIREGQGAGQRADNVLTIPVCPSCHLGPMGIHGDKTMLRLKKWTELDALADTIEKIATRLMR